MYKNERKNEILKILSGQGYTTVKQLSDLLYTSESSIRRDLILLEKQGLVMRRYGGVALSRNHADIIPFSTRAHRNISAKKAIAKRACQLIHEGDILFLDQSSSAFYVAWELQKASNLTVVTNNLEIASLLSTSDIDVIVSGGHLCKANRNCLIGEDSNSIFSQIRADLVFFSAKAVSDDGIIYDCAREEVCVRNVMLKNARKKAFLCTSDKVNAHANYKQCSLKDVDYLITESNQSPKFSALEAFVTVIA